MPLKRPCLRSCRFLACRLSLKTTQFTRGAPGVRRLRKFSVADKRRVASQQSAHAQHHVRHQALSRDKRLLARVRAYRSNKQVLLLGRPVAEDSAVCVKAHSEEGQHLRQRRQSDDFGPAGPAQYACAPARARPLDGMGMIRCGREKCIPAVKAPMLDAVRAVFEVTAQGSTHS